MSCNLKTQRHPSAPSIVTMPPTPTRAKTAAPPYIGESSAQKVKTPCDITYRDGVDNGLDMGTVSRRHNFRCNGEHHARCAGGETGQGLTDDDSFDAFGGHRDYSGNAEERPGS